MWKSLIFTGSCDAIGAGNARGQVKKRKRDPQNDNPPQLTSSNIHKASGRKKAVQLQMSKHVNRDLLTAINDYSLTAWVR